MKKLVALILTMTSVIANANSFHDRIRNQQLVELRQAGSIEKEKRKEDKSIGYQVAVTALNNKNYNTALQIFLGRAKNGLSSSQFQLGKMYQNGQGVVKDDSQAIYWYTQAAEQGHIDAAFNLGWLYGNGDSTVQDKAQAFKWYRKAAGEGDAESQFLVGDLYATGQGVAQDYARALFWYTLAAEKGNAFAQNNLGILHQDGRGTLQDNSRAHMWYNIAGLNGSEQARKYRDMISARMNSQELERAQQLARECVARNYKRCY